MTFTRRRFITSGAVAAFAASVALNSGALVFGQGMKKSDPALDFPVPFQAQQGSIFYFKRETFQPYVGGIFRISAGRHSVNATLKEVRDCTPSAKSNAVTKRARTSDCFALVFQTTRQLTDLTTIFTVEHAALGKFDLFLTRRDQRGVYFYEAVVNHSH